MRSLFRIFTPLVAAALCLGAAEVARAQGAGAPAAPPAAAKYDEYGRVGHCDMTARLDNLAVELQSDPKLKVFVVSYDPQKRRGYADHNLKISRYYLVNVRGIAPERVVAVDGGQRDTAEGVTQLWVVPEGAEPPVAAPALDKYTAKDFSGKFDSHVTDGRTYKVLVEMGYTGSEIAYTEFAQKLKAQPESVGYLVVLSPKDALAGDWRRVGRRDEQILTKDYGVEAGRLQTLNGGQSAGDYSEVEFWILPKSAPPPSSYMEELTATPKAAVRLNRLDSYGSLDKDAERWMLENLAELLRENPRASACLVAREEMTYEVEEEPGEGTEAEAVEAEEVAEESAAEGEAAESAEAEAGAEEEVTGSASEFAERWKDILVNQHGVEAHRVVVLEGRQMSWSVNRLTTWLVPENAPLPDASARDEDEIEEEEPRPGAGDKEAAAASTPEQGEQPREEPAAGETPGLAARKVSEYVNLFSSCNAGAHLDNFAVELQNDAQAVAYVVGYAPGGKEGRYGQRLLDVTKNYLVNARGLDESRVKVVNGGRYKNALEAATELWLVPQGAEPPPVVEYADEPGTFEGKFADYVGWDGYGHGEGMSWSSTDEVALAAFADQLRRQPKAVAYLVGYNFSGSTIGTWRRVLSKEAAALEAAGVERGRIKTIFGGKAKAGKEESSGEGVARVQLWVLPPDAPPPVKEARRERRPKETQRLASLPGYTLGSGDEARALEGLADVLRGDETLRGFLVVRVSSGESPEMAAGDESGRETPEVDAGTGQRWKKQLAEKYGISENRLVVLVVPPGENSPLYGEVETFVVPPGAAPPNPYAEEAGEEEEPDEESRKES